MGKKWRKFKARLSTQLNPLYRMRGQTILHCLGDSHISMFADWKGAQKLPHTTIRPTVVYGATALGLVNFKSKTNALEKLSAQVKLVQPTDFALFLVGEVDCGFLIWCRAARQGVSVLDQFEESLTNYRNFVKNSGLSPEQTIICSATLPTIKDGQDWGEVATARREVTATLRERTELTQAYNKRLEAWCKEENRRFLSFERETTDPETGLIADNFLHPDPLDHHLDHAQIQPILRQKLVELGFC